MKSPGSRPVAPTKCVKSLIVSTSVTKDGADWRGVEAVDSAGIAYTSYEGWSDEVPSVVGMGLKEAVYLLERRGMVVAFSGVGGVEFQSVPAGTKVHRGMLIRLELGCTPLEPGIYLKEKKADSSADSVASSGRGD